MRRAGQTPHGARPNREGFSVEPSGLLENACRLGAPQPPGRSLEPHSNARPRGMTVLSATADRIRLTAPAPTGFYFLPLPNHGIPLCPRRDTVDRRRKPRDLPNSHPPLVRIHA